MPDFTVARRGTDTSGRAILLTNFYWLVWQAVLRDPRVDSFADRIVIVQAAFMSRLGGGAAASAGYHDLGGCIDVRTWNLTLAEQAILWEVCDEYGIRFWKRGPAAVMGGMDEHGHGIGGWDKPLAAGAASQWTQGKTGRDGLAGNAPDYMRRHGPVATYPPAHLLQEDYMATDDARDRLTRIEALVKDLAADVGELGSDERRRFQADLGRQKAARKKTYALLGGIADQLTELANDTRDDATGAQIRALKASVLAELRDDPDVDGPDKPTREDQP